MSMVGYIMMHAVVGIQYCVPFYSYTSPGDNCQRIIMHVEPRAPP